MCLFLWGLWEKKNNQPFSLGLNLSSASIRWTPTVSKHYAGWWIDGWKSCGWIAQAISQAVNNAREVAPAMHWAVRGRRGCVLREWESMETIPFVSIVDLTRFTPGQESKGAGWRMEHFNMWWFVCCHSNFALLFCGYHNKLSQHRGLLYSSGDEKSGKGLSELRSRCRQGMLFLEALWGILSLPSSRGCPHFLAHGPLCSSNPATVSWVFLPRHYSFFCLLCVRTLVITLGSLG